MNPEPKPQNANEKLIQEFLDKGGEIKKIPFGETSGFEYKTSFYGKRNKKAEEKQEKGSWCLTNFEKTAIITELELLSDDFEMVETDDTKVLDTTQMTPKEIARLKLIIEASKWKNLYLSQLRWQSV